MKKSKQQRKFVNQMRAMADVPWPARRFKYPATMTITGTGSHEHLGSCKRVLGETKVRRGRLRRKQSVDVVCGGKVFLRRGSLGKRRVYCADCQARKRERLRALRIQRQIQSRFGIDARPQREEKSSKFKRFLRKGR